MLWIILIVLLVLTFGITAVLSGVGRVAQTTQGLAQRGQALRTPSSVAAATEGQEGADDDSPANTTAPAASTPTNVTGGAQVVTVPTVVSAPTVVTVPATAPALVTPVSTIPIGAPVRSFVEFGEVATAHPVDIWLDNVALTIPPSNVGTTDIIFVDPNRPQQCYARCKNSPFCRFFSYWRETGACNMYQTLQNGETTPENMIRYAYTVPYSQHWTSGYIKKSGAFIPPNLLI